MALFLLLSRYRIATAIAVRFSPGVTSGRWRWPSTASWTRRAESTRRGMGCGGWRADRSRAAGAPRTRRGGGAGRAVHPAKLRQEPGICRHGRGLARSRHRGHDGSVQLRRRGLLPRSACRARRPSRLALHHRCQESRVQSVVVSDYREYRDHVRSFRWRHSRSPRSTCRRDEPFQALGAMVSGNYFGVLGVRPALGRVITPDDDRTEGGAPVACCRTDSGCGSSRPMRHHRPHGPDERLGLPK